MSQESEQMDAIIGALERIALSVEQMTRSQDQLVDVFALADLGGKMDAIAAKLEAIKEKMPSVQV